MRDRNYLLLIMVLVFMLTGCNIDNSVTVLQDESSTEEPEKVTYEAMLYDNQGNNFLSFEGNNFNITPNRVKLYGWNSSGTWTSYYEASPVVTIEIDGKYIQSCGSTIIFKDTRLDMLDIPRELSTASANNTNGYTVSDDNQVLEDFIGLRLWWYDKQEKGQYGEKVILIQSQDGYNIGAFVGSDITWQVADRLPKTTKIMIDGLPIYIHRCNFTIIDSELMNNSLD